MKPLRDALIVASFELAVSLRTRKVLVFLVIYVAGAIGSTVLFTEVLREVEAQFAEQLLVARTDTPGSLTQAVMESPELHGMLLRLVRDAPLASALVRIPPVALLYGWVALTFAPIFVVLTSSDVIASEVASGSVRFALFRTDRAAWAFGKLLGQAALLAFGIAAGALATWITGWIRLASFAPIDSAFWIARYAATSYCFAFAHLGLALGISQLTRSVPWSRALGLFALAFVFAAHGWLSLDHVKESAPVLTASLRMFLPAAHRLDLWRPNPADFAPSVLVLIALGVSYFVLGNLRFVRRDT